jgi:hypothetical protein
VAFISGVGPFGSSESQARSAGPGRSARLTTFLLALAIVAVLLLLAMLQSVSVHMGAALVEDPDEPDVPDDYDCVLLEGKTGAHYLHITLTVKGLIQPGDYVGPLALFRYDVGVWARDPDTGPFVYLLKYIEGEEQNYGVETQVDGDKLMFEFPLSFVRSGAYIVGLSAVVHNDETWDIVGEEEARNAEIQKLITLPGGPLVMVVVAILVGVVGVLVFAWPVIPGKTPRRKT